MAKKKAAPLPWKNCIVGYGSEDPTQLLANDKNWRIHPHAQELALSEVMREVGLCQNIVVNKRSGKVVDGHLRVAMAISEGQPALPITYVDLSDEQEALILASLDPLSAMAGTDTGKLTDLLSQFMLKDGELRIKLMDLAEMPNFSPTSQDEQGRLDQKSPISCPACGHEFTP